MPHSHDIQLSAADKARLDRDYPAPGNSDQTGKRSVELVKIYLHSLDPECKLEEPNGPVDLRIIKSAILPWKDIEIKGTAAPQIAWNQLKVSGKPSMENLQRGVPLFRVCNVYSDTPFLFILQHGKDFSMVPEDRWRICPSVTLDN